MKFLPLGQLMLFLAISIFSDILTVSKTDNCQLSALFETMLHEKGFDVKTKSVFTEFNILTIPTNDDSLVQYINSLKSPCIAIEKETKFKTQ